MKLYLDYCGNGSWVVSFDPRFSFPRVNVCCCPVRLLQHYLARGYEIILSDAAQLICENDLLELSSAKQYFRALQWVEKYYPSEM